MPTSVSTAVPIFSHMRRIWRPGKRGSYSGATEGGILSDTQVRLATVPIGIALTVIVSMGSAAYALLTWGEDNRGLILAISIAGLLTDLKQRGLLDETLVVWAGEMGRTPRVFGGGTALATDEK